MAKQSFWSRHFLGVELTLSLLAAAGFYAWVAWYGGRPVVDAILEGKRDALYGTLASIYGALLGFVIAAITIALGYSESEKFEVLRNSKYYRTLWQTFTSSIWALSLATVSCVVALLFEKGPETNAITIGLVAFGTLFAMARVARVIWVIERLVEILTDRSDGSPRRKH